MKTYEKIRAIRNKHFPPKLEFGCDIIGGDYDGTILHKTVGGAYVYRHFPDAEDTVHESLYILKEDIKKILGKPVSLNDILMLIKKSNNVMRIDSDGICEIWHYDEDENDYFDIIKLDLSKSIKDQKPKVLKSIWELIK